MFWKFTPVAQEFAILTDLNSEAFEIEEFNNRLFFFRISAVNARKLRDFANPEFHTFKLQQVRLLEMWRHNYSTIHDFDIFWIGSSECVKFDN